MRKLLLALPFALIASTAMSQEIYEYDYDGVILFERVQDSENSQTWHYSVLNTLDNTVCVRIWVIAHPDSSWGYTDGLPSSNSTTVVLSRELPPVRLGWVLLPKVDADELPNRFRWKWDWDPQGHIDCP